jgi:outer membrane receptor protein involved in Fe transport
MTLQVLFAFINARSIAAEKRSILVGKIMIKHSLRMAASAAVIALIATPAVAQLNEDEIIVTATKRATTLQDTPVAVTVTSADVIEKAQILDIKDLQAVVPTFRVSQLQNSANTTLTIRGFGNGGNNYGIEPAVGLFIDGVYRSRAAAQISDLPALERIEVLSGPQSTLFGKNASAGVVSIVTEAPQYDTTGYIEGGIGNYNQNYAKAYITGGLTDTLAASLGLGYQKRDGYFDVIGGVDEDLNNLDRFNWRGQLLWEPTDNLSVRLIADQSSIAENCCGTGVAIEGPLAAGAPTAGQVIALLGGRQPSAADQFTYETFVDTETFNEIDDGGLSAQIDYDLGFATLTSITAYRETVSEYINDSDYNSLEILPGVFQTNELDTFTQELRLTSNGGSQLEWMIGGYFFDETIDQDSGFDYGADTRRYLEVLANGGLASTEQILGFAPGTFFAEGQGVNETFVQDNQAFSIFGTLDFEVNDRLTLSVGANYTEDKKDVSGSSVNTDVFGNVDLEGAAGLQILTVGALAANFPAFAQSCIDPTTGAPFGALPFSPANAATVSASPACFVDPTDLTITAPGAAAFAGFQAQVAAGAGAIDRTSLDPDVNPLAGLFGLQFQPQFLAFPNAVEDGRTKDDELTYSVKAAYEVNNNMNVYGSYATGFKASSWNLTRDSRPFFADAAALSAEGLLPNGYNPTTGRNFGTRFSAPETVEVFEIGFKGRWELGAINIALFDQTVNNFQSTIFQGTGFVLSNAGQQSTQGFEFDSTFTPIEPLTLTFAGVIQDPIYDSFTSAPVVTGSEVDRADGVVDGNGDLSGQQPAGINQIALSASATYTHLFENGMSAFIRGQYQYEDEVAIVDNIPGLTRDTSVFNGSFGVELENGLAVRVWGNNLFNHETYTSAFPGVVQAGTFNAYPNQPRTYGVSLRKNF